MEKSGDEGIFAASELNSGINGVAKDKNGTVPIPSMCWRTFRVWNPQSYVCAAGRGWIALWHCRKDVLGEKIHNVSESERLPFGRQRNPNFRDRPRHASVGICQRYGHGGGERLLKRHSKGVK
jgi:hypothetical protein